MNAALNLADIHYSLCFTINRLITVSNKSILTLIVIDTNTAADAFLCVRVCVRA